MDMKQAGNAWHFYVHNNKIFLVDWPGPKRFIRYDLGVKMNISIPDFNEMQGSSSWPVKPCYSLEDLDSDEDSFFSERPKLPRSCTWDFHASQRQRKPRFNSPPQPKELEGAARTRPVAAIKQMYRRIQKVALEMTPKSGKFGYPIRRYDVFASLGVAVMKEPPHKNDNDSDSDEIDLLRSDSPQEERRKLKRKELKANLKRNQVAARMSAMEGDGPKNTPFQTPEVIDLVDLNQQGEDLKNTEKKKQTLPRSVSEKQTLHIDDLKKAGFVRKRCKPNIVRETKEDSCKKTKRDPVPGSACNFIAPLPTVHCFGCEGMLSRIGEEFETIPMPPREACTVCDGRCILEDYLFY